MQGPIVYYPWDYSLQQLQELKNMLLPQFTAAKISIPPIFVPNNCVVDRQSVEIDALEEAHAAELHEKLENIRADLVEKVNNYLNYVVESWMEDNKLAIRNRWRP